MRKQVCSADGLPPLLTLLTPEGQSKGIYVTVVITSETDYNTVGTEESVLISEMS